MNERNPNTNECAKSLVCYEQSSVHTLHTFHVFCIVYISCNLYSTSYKTPLHVAPLTVERACDSRRHQLCVDVMGG